MTTYRDHITEALDMALEDFEATGDPRFADLAKRLQSALDLAEQIER